ncbi:hypothetical protein [uncultured Bacteroides sp.]|uniref:hypothetical protein n=1 Tax=uncultured Bacteroides sp. TaxID=162156 RepID=UPI0025861CFF|nr:hypothetical protein [uncultured Bacteroides sp.]
METCPDSALLLLNQIPQSEKLQGKECADYALLLTQVRDKNYLDSLQSDSLIKLTVDYYQDSDDKVRGGKALFYYGKVIALQGDNEKAMQAYLDAQERLEGTKEYKLQAWIQEYVGRINDDQERYDMALDNYQKSIFYNKKKVKCNEQDYRESLQKYMKQNKEIIAANEQLISQYISQI